MLHGDSHDSMKIHSREAEKIQDRPAVRVIYEGVASRCGTTALAVQRLFQTCIHSWGSPGEWPSFLRQAEIALHDPHGLGLKPLQVGIVVGRTEVFVPFGREDAQ